MLMKLQSSVGGGGEIDRAQETRERTLVIVGKEAWERQRTLVIVGKESRETQRTSDQ